MELINYEEAAELLGIARGTVYSMVHHNRIPHVRMGPRLVRFDRAELEAFIEAHKVQSVAAGACSGDRRGECA